jgi:hypothetical protein
MTQQRGTTIKQSAVSGVMSRLSELPDRGKDSGSAISLGKVFRTKEYLAEIKGALKKGYTFDDLAAIFTERCGVSITARQMKYHFTREKNRRSKSNSGEKSNRQDTSEGDVPRENATQTESVEEMELGAKDTGAAANADVTANHVPKPAAFAEANGETCPAETGTFFFKKRQ